MVIDLDRRFPRVQVVGLNVDDIFEGRASGKLGALVFS